MAWTVALAGIIYLRAMRQTEEAQASPPSRWSLSGGPEWQQRAQNYSFTLDYETLRTIAHEFRCYIEDLTLSLPVAGLPPSLLYFHHLSREQYVYTLASSVPELRELFLLVLKMVSGNVVSRFVRLRIRSPPMERQLIPRFPFLRASASGSCRSWAFRVCLTRSMRAGRRL